jgi:hypothetical protein
MRGSLGGLHCRRNLRIRHREESRDLLGQGLVGGQPGKLTLPQVEIAPRKLIERA